MKPNCSEFPKIETITIKTEPWFWARQWSTSSTVTIPHYIMKIRWELFRVTFIWSQWTSASSSFPKFIFGCSNLTYGGWGQEFFKLFRVTFILYWPKPTYSIPKIGLCMCLAFRLFNGSNRWHPEIVSEKKNSGIFLRFLFKSNLMQTKLRNGRNPHWISAEKIDLTVAKKFPIDIHKKEQSNTNNTSQ